MGWGITGLASTGMGMGSALILGLRGCGGGGVGDSGAREPRNGGGEIGGMGFRNYGRGERFCHLNLWKCGQGFGESTISDWWSLKNVAWA